MCSLCDLTGGELRDIAAHNRAAKRLGIRRIEASAVRDKRERERHRPMTYDEILSLAISDIPEDKSDGFTFTPFRVGRRSQWAYRALIKAVESGKDKSGPQGS